jgi:two-component system sensor histidine kinase UhpB
MTLDAKRERGNRAGSVIRALLGLPLLYKLLIANVVLVLAVAVIGAVFTAELLRADPTLPTPQIIAVFALVGVGVTASGNVLVLQLALSPLKLLEQTAKRVRRGDRDVQAHPSALADSELRGLTETFNETLDALAAYRLRVRKIAAAALHAAEGERKRIALELHDDTAPTLVALLARIGAARATSDPSARDAQLEEIRNELANAIEGVRRIARALRPAALEEMGVVAAILEHARSVEDASGLRIGVDADLIDGLLAPDAELAVYRIIQEALANAVRHSEPRNVQVRIRRRHRAVVAAVSDDGNGFSADEGRAANGGLGLLGMRERAEVLGGRVDVRSRPGRGTLVRVEIPITGGVDED